MTFRFIHTADWQIGKPFENIGGDVASLLREARLGAIERLADVARNHQTPHVLVAGDVLDSATAQDRLLRQLLQRLAGQSGIRWHLLPGNHDPASPRGVWDRMRSLGDLPANVELHTEERPAELAPGVVLLPAPLHARASHEDPTRWMDTVPSPDGTIRIGLAHGSVHGFGSEGDAAVPIMPSRVGSANLAFLALGDWHGTKRITDRIWYAGTPEPDQFADNDPGNALVVSLEDARAPPVLKKLRTAQFNWARRSVHLSPATTGLEAILSEIAALGAAAQNQLLSLEIDGTVSMSMTPALESTLARLDGMVRHLVTKRDQLRILISGDDAWDTRSPILARVSADLQTAATGEIETARTAERALALLASLAAGDGTTP